MRLVAGGDAGNISGMRGDIASLRVKRGLPRIGFDVGFLGLALLVCIAATLALARHGIPPKTSFWTNAVLYLSCWLAFELPIYLLALRRAAPDSPLRFTGGYLASRSGLYVKALPLVMVLVVYMPIFSTVKAAIPYFAPYTWDTTFIAWDRALFGRDAWRVLQPVLGYPIVTSAMSLAYHGWILLIYAGGLYFACYQRAHRHRYFLSFLAIWTIGGMLMAIGFASVGPCFVESFFGDRTFASQMAYLHAADREWPVMVLPVQQELLEWYRSGQHGLGRGITAMPSMHVAEAMLFWLAIRPLSRKAGWFFFAFYVVIFAGSVHLGYHYAVDGIASSLLTLAVWWASGLAAKRGRAFVAARSGDGAGSPPRQSVATR